MILEPLPTEDFQCQLCGIQGFPLKRFVDKWYHINCLLLHDMGMKQFIKPYFLVFYNYGEFSLKQKKLDQALIQANNSISVCHLCGIAS